MMMKLSVFRLVLLALMSWGAVHAAEDTPKNAPKDALKVSAEVLNQMASDQFEQREQAYGELKSWAAKHRQQAPEILYQVWKGVDNPEVKARCHALMKQSAIQRKFGKGKGFVGIMMDPVGQVAIRVLQVLPNTPAQKAGLQPGDVIVGIDALDFSELKEKKASFDARDTFQAYVSGKQPDDVVTLHLERGGAKLDKQVTLMKRPASADRGIFGQGQDRAKLEAEAFFKQWFMGMENAPSKEKN
ncbi:PDZ domain-containing protein [Verrucomicrobiaceae bacterium N1E253]|uniref:PDZ domain-containing protein n=1 Tax=Oceaniferula marina TaxID=2748318 RepID=A0A851GRN3_9BACT|nr:PDZ domain-containing protein [Oceaniferula marina]NWK56874.1 PDZ domain-containing protein [Oceaniferula marina]